MSGSILEYVINTIMVKDKIETLMDDHPSKALTYIQNNQDELVDQLTDTDDIEVSAKDLFQSKTFKEAYPDLYDFVQNEYEEILNA